MRSHTVEVVPVQYVKMVVVRIMRESLSADSEVSSSSSSVSSSEVESSGIGRTTPTAYGSAEDSGKSSSKSEIGFWVFPS